MRDRLYQVTKIQASEALGAAIAFVFVLVLMTSYFIAKPVRDEMASTFTDVELAQLWTYTFIFSTIAVFIYNVLASKVCLKKLVPGVFLFFAASFILVAIGLQTGIDTILLGKCFYVWISVFSLFHISVFWSFISQHYSKEQSKRVFAFINTGASAGAILGSSVVIKYAELLPLETTLYVTSFMLVLVIPMIIGLNVHFKNKQNIELPERLNPNPFSGLQEFFTHKRLIGIGAFIFVFAGISSFFYIAQKEILVEFPRAERKEILGQLDLYGSILTILLGIFASNRIAGKFGLSTSLALVPAIVSLSLVLFATTPTVAMFLALQLIRKAGNYSITRPAREILFSGVDREARFKTKPFIDVAIYRGADVFWVWFLAALGTEGLGLSLPGRLLVGAVIALGWATLGYHLGKRHEASVPPTKST